MLVLKGIYHYSYPRSIRRYPRCLKGEGDGPQSTSIRLSRIPTKTEHETNNFIRDLQPAPPAKSAHFLVGDPASIPSIPSPRSIRFGRHVDPSGVRWRSGSHSSTSWTTWKRQVSGATHFRGTRRGSDGAAPAPCWIPQGPRGKKQKQTEMDGLFSI